MLDPNSSAFFFSAPEVVIDSWLEVRKAEGARVPLLVAAPFGSLRVWGGGGSLGEEAVDELSGAVAESSTESLPIDTWESPCVCCCWVGGDGRLLTFPGFVVEAADAVAAGGMLVAGSVGFGVSSAKKAGAGRS